MVQLRLRTPEGAQTIHAELDSTLQELLAQLWSLTSIPPDEIELRSGFPPKPLDTSAQDQTLSQLSIKGGDSLVVSRKAASAATPAAAPRASEPVAAPAPVPAPRAAASSSNNAAPATSKKGGKPDNTYVEAEGGFLTLRVVPDDNSCLFTAVGLLLEPNRSNAPSYLRQVVAETIKSDPFNYSSAMLGQEPSSYISKILSPSTWGGAVELSIFADKYKVEVNSVDVQTGRVDTFGEGKGYPTGVFVVYSGIHYDAVTLSFTKPSSAPGLPDLGFDQLVFDSSSALIPIAVQELVKKLANQHYYTDTATFALKCLVCGLALTGEKEAREHAGATSHAQFGEYDG